MRPMGPGGFNQRPAPYDRGDRFGGMNRYNNIGRGSRSFKGESACVSFYPCSSKQCLHHVLCICNEHSVC
jgi:hypothetical protein